MMSKYDIAWNPDGRCDCSLCLLDDRILIFTTEDFQYLIQVLSVKCEAVTVYKLCKVYCCIYKRC